MISRNKRTYIALAMVIGLIAIFGYFFLEKKYDSTIKFNYESGFYDEPIEVELSVGDNYFMTYTLDGRAPNAACPRYEGPIMITDASENDNVWSAMRETSLRYFQGEQYELPDYNVDKCTILRVAAFDYEGNQVSTEVREYFVGFEDKKGYEGIYNLCVVSDPENLFSLERGIYSVDTWLKGKIDSCKIWDMRDEEGEWYTCHDKANWYKHGIEWERPATIELFDPNGDAVFSEDCGVRIYGARSRDNVQKSLRFFARPEYSGKNTFSYDLFKTGDGTHSFICYSLGQDQDVKIKDYVIFSALYRRGDDPYYREQMIPCNVFLEGEYWGPMFLMKTVSRETISHDYGVDEENISLIKGKKVKLDDDQEEIYDSEWDDWNSLLSFVRLNDMKDPENYKYVCDRMDINDFAKYVATEIYIGNGDWHIDNNYACWRVINQEKGNSYADGKWRFILFDVNWTILPQGDVWEMVYEDWDFYHMVRSLCQNEEFKKLYLQNMRELETIFEGDTVASIIDEWSSVMQDPIECNFRRFTNLEETKVEGIIEGEKEEIINYFINRPADMNTLNEWMLSE